MGLSITSFIRFVVRRDPNNVCKPLSIVIDVQKKSINLRYNEEERRRKRGNKNRKKMRPFANQEFGFILYTHHFF